MESPDGEEAHLVDTSRESLDDRHFANEIDLLDLDDVEFGEDSPTGDPTPSASIAGLVTEIIAVEQHLQAKGSIPSAAFNIANTVIGAGILSLAFALRMSGPLIGMILMVVMCILAGITIQFLVLVSHAHPEVEKTYEGISKAAFGRVGVMAVAFAVAGSNMGGMVSYTMAIIESIRPILLILSDNILPSSYAHSLNMLLQYRLFLLVPVAAILLLLTLSPYIRWLAYTSFLSLLAVLLVSIYLAVQALLHSWASLESGSTAANEVVSWEFWESIGALWVPIPSWRFFLTIPAIAYAFSCHTSVFPVYRELKRASPQRMALASWPALFFCLLVYMLGGAGGFFLFQSQTCGNILQNFANNNLAINGLRLLFALTLLLTYPLCFFSTRQVLDYLIFCERKDRYRVRFYAWTLSLNLTVWLIALIAPNIALVFDLAGSTSGALSSYILPSLLFIKMAPARYRSLKVFAGVLCVAGVLLAICGTTATIIAWIFPFHAC